MNARWLHNFGTLLLLVGSIGYVFAQSAPPACVNGTVASYLAAGPCSFGVGTVKLTGYSNSFGLPPDQTSVHPNMNGTYIFFSVGNGNASGPLAWNGAGTVSVQLLIDVPPLDPTAGLVYFLSEDGADGCCTEPGFALNFLGGTLTTSITITSTMSLPPDREGRTLAVVTDWSYSSAAGSKSGQSTDSPQAHYNMEAVVFILPHVQAGTVPLQITTTSLSTATSGQAYSTTLAAIGGTGINYTWSVSAGTLPSGFGLTSGGLLSSTGTPAAVAQSYGFTVKVTDSASNNATQQLALVVQAGSTLPSAVVGQPYDSGQLTLPDGSAGIGWFLSSGNLPSGFIVFGTGKILALDPVQVVPGKYSFQLTTRDANNHPVVQSYTLVVLAAVTILDPVCAQPCQNLLNGPRITNVRTVLASGGRPVLGIAADGIAQVVFRVPTLASGDQVTATLLNDQCANPPCAPSNSSDDDGGLFAVGSAVTSAEPLSNTTSDTSDAFTLTTFLAYRAPADFARMRVSTDVALAKRAVYVQLNYSSGGTAYGSQIVQLMIVRAPVIVIHGLTSSPCSWTSFTPLIGDQRFNIYKLSYDQDIDDRVTTTTPDFGILSYFLYSINANVVGVDWNARQLLAQLRTAIESYADNFSYPDPCGLPKPASFGPIAAVRADIVGHSMGGLIARAMWYVSEFSDDTTYNHGYIHKLITLGTPHLGSHNAKRLMDGTNECVRRNTAVWAGLTTGTASFAFQTLVIDGETVSGAVADLVGDGTVKGSSNLIKKLQTTPTGTVAPRLKMATIAGQANQTQFNAIDGTVRQFVIQHSACKTEFLATNFTGSGWRNVFDGEDNDALVSVGSALNVPAPLLFGSTNVLLNAVHGHGTVEDLGFGHPHLQEYLSGAPIKVIDLLNSSANSSAFVSVP